MQSSDSQGKQVALLGVGNTGSHLAPLLAQTPEVSRLLIVDLDVYEENNLGCQAFPRSALGSSKARVQARQMRAIHPGLATEGLHAAVEDVPLGKLRVDLIACCLDSRVSRQYVNQAAWRLGVPWVDIAVDGPGRTARVGVYRPTDSASCLECRWDETDYGALEPRYACKPGDRQVAATNASASLGSVAASIAAIECQKVLADQWAHALVGREVFVDLEHHTHFVSHWRKNQNCKFDHAVWQIEPIAASPKAVTLADLCARAKCDASDTRVALGMAGHRFSPRLYCRECGTAGPQRLRLARRIGISRQACASCGGGMATRGFELRDWLELQNMNRRELSRTLAGLGFQSSDVITVRTADRAYYFQLDVAGAADSPPQEREVQTAVV